MGRPKEDAVKRFWNKVKKTDSCWVWLGGKFRRGYGQFTLNGKNTKAHRFSFQLHYKKNPGSLQVCHKCDNPSCVNPKHLFLGSQFENVRDQISKGRRHDTSGEKNGSAKLEKSTVLKIRKDYKEGKSQYTIAAKYEISQPHVSDIVNRKRWKQL